ncbi:hypothetical protein ACTXT7_012142 [Hymenolepis weldensis]
MAHVKKLALMEMQIRLILLSITSMNGSRHKYLQAFQTADKDKSGSLDRSELAAALNSQGIPESEIDTLMDQLDINGDGVIHLREYEMALGISTQPINAWQALFKELDSDGSGVIEFNELKAFLRGNNAEDLIPILDDWMGDYDVNGDGKLNYREFLGFVCALSS